MGAVVLGGCSWHSLSDYKGGTPPADIQSYFDGPIQAWGMVQDWRGRVVRRFTINMLGKWEGNVGTLTEDFVYDDGKTQQRIWRITKLPNGQYEGKADDIIGTAIGSSEGHAIRWQYVMDIPVDGTTYRIRFDDWMWAMNDGVMMNRSYLKKFGLTVAELTIFMKKLPSQ
ncbi:DUF3833 domain-containing protein [bacterium]|nr:DUF3833 domain-containing protein [bacterium]